MKFIEKLEGALRMKMSMGEAFRLAQKESGIGSFVPGTLIHKTESPRHNAGRSAYRSWRWGAKHRIDLKEHAVLTFDAVKRLGGITKASLPEARILQLRGWENGRSPDATARTIYAEVGRKP
jgi:hypothetical protein